jgi:hypothetical protein
MPYDPPDQASWMLNAATNGYPSVQVSDQVQTFQAYGMGSCCCFFNQGVPIEATNAFLVSTAPGVQLHDVFTRFLNASGGVEHVVNGVAQPDANQPGPSDIVTHP